MEISEPLFRVSSRTKIRYVTPKVNRTIQFQLVSYFQPWFNFCHYILLVPFKIEHNGSAYFIRTNMFQKILCGILHPVICINGFFEFHEKFTEKIRHNPQIFMRAFDRINTILLCLMFFYTVWFRKIAITKICNDSSSHVATGKVKRNVRFCCLVWLSLSLAAFVVQTLDIEGSGWTRGLQQLIQTFRFEYFFTKGIEHEDQYIPTTELPLVGTVVALFLRIYKWVLVDFIDSVILLVGFASYKMCKQFKLTLTNSNSSKLWSDDDSIFELHSRLARIFNQLNDLIGPIMALTFVFTTTLCAINVIDVLDSDGWSLKILIVYYVLVQTLGMIFCAEAHHQASYFKTWLLLRHRNGGCLTNLTDYLLEVEQCNLALKGGKYFTVTYTYLGTACSVALTYAIIMIQFQGRSCST